jgi:hypothetical protein
MDGRRSFITEVRYAHPRAIFAVSGGGDPALPGSVWQIALGMSLDPLWKRLRDFDWMGVNLSGDEARKIQKLLQDLSARREVRAMKASQELWTFLRARPGLAVLVRPFLQDIRHISEPAVQGEIDDLIGLE